jgi:hypothetical protein
MTTTKQHKFGLTELLVIIQVTIVLFWFWRLSSLTPIDSFSVIPFQIFGWLTSLSLLIYASTTLKTLQTKTHKITRLLLTIVAFVIFYSVDKLADRYPDQYRFTITNKTGLTIDNLILNHHDQQQSVDNFSTDTKAKLKLNYWEAESFYIVAHRADKVDTIYLPIGGTNSIGYIYNVDIEIKDNKITADIDNGEKSSL